jgi:soluble lytic murein transglycosylase-like protein
LIDMSPAPARRRPVLALVATVLVVGWSAVADAERLTLVNGRTLSVKSYHTDGDLMTVALKGGGEATFNASMVVAIAPDEVPSEPESAPVAVAEAEVVTPKAADPTLVTRPFAQLISNVAAKHGLEAALVHAVVRAESNYAPRARSEDGARGLMQVMPATGREFGIRNLYDPQSNLEAGVQYLKSLLTRFTLPHAIAAYNAGPAIVKKYGGVPPFRETQDYVRRVLADIAR